MTVSVALFNSCSDDEDYIPTTKIEIIPNNISLLMGSSEDISVKVYPENATDQFVTWKCSDEGVAKIENKKIIGLKVGKAKITATTKDNISATCSVEVTKEIIHVSEIKLSKKNLDIEVGLTSKLVAEIVPGNATNDNYTWASSNTDVITVKDGLVTAIKVGNAKVIVTSEDGNKTDECSVNVSESENVSSFTDPRDNKTYRTVKIGDQVWMAENLAFLPKVSSTSNADYSKEMYLVYDYSGIDVEEAKKTSNYKKYGVLYNYTSANLSCPEGWRLPTDDDWKELEKFLGIGDDDIDLMDNFRGDIAPKMMSTVGWTGCVQATNESMFSAVPSGLYTLENGFSRLNDDACYWTRSFLDLKKVIARRLFKDYSGVERTSAKNTTMLSVRCIKVKIIHVTSVSLELENAKVKEGESITLAVNVLPEDATNRSIIWSSSDESVATVSGGLVNTLKEGTTTITATSEDGNFSDNLTLVVEKKNDPVNDGRCVDPDGREYKTVKIGEQVWMAENYAYLPSITDPYMSSYTRKSYFVYGYNGANIDEAKQTDSYKKYGVLYNRVAAVECAPKGWHLPSHEEWIELERFIGMTDEEIESAYSRGDKGKKLMSTTGWSSNEGTDDYGFSALPGGYLSPDEGEFYFQGSSAYFFTSTWDGSDCACKRTISNGSITFSNYSNIRNGFSVRYVKDKE